MDDRRQDPAISVVDGNVVPGLDQKLMRLVPEPPFHDPGELERTWGRRWGAEDEIGPLREVLLRAPGSEFEAIHPEAWNPDAAALVDPDGRWFWGSRQPPDRARLAAQHAELVATLEREGVSVRRAPSLGGGYSKSIYTRDPLVAMPGGFVVGRLAPAMRRGEEADLSRLVASLGAPILRTIAGTGVVEGGSVIRLRGDVVAFGLSIRCNEGGARQLEETLAPFGIALLRVPLCGYSIHLDGSLALLDAETALVRAERLPYWFLDELTGLGYELLHCPEDEPWGVNLLALRPGRVLMSSSSPRTAERLVRRGIEVLSVPYDEVERNGGGVHCSTQELWREPA